MSEQQAGGARDAEHDRRWFTEWAPSIGAVGDARVAAGTLRQLMLAALHWIGEHKDARAECQRLAAELAAVRAERDELRQACRPFAEQSKLYSDKWGDDQPIFNGFVFRDGKAEPIKFPTLGELRRLARLLAGRDAAEPSTQGDTHADTD